MSHINVPTTSLALPTPYLLPPMHQENLPTPINLVTRDAPSIPTIYLAPSSDYAQTVTSAPTVTGSDISLVARSQPSDGVDLYLAPDILKNVQNALSRNCPQTNSPSCQSSIQSAINPQEIGIQARQVGALLLIASAITLLSAIAIQVYGMVDATSQQHNNHVHLNAADLAQVSSAQSASTVLFATASADPNMVSVTQSVTTAGASGGATVSTVTADANGYSTGDVIIMLPPDLAAVLTDIVAQRNSCVRSPKRSLSLDCFVSIASGMLQEVVPGGPAAGLLVLPTMVPQITLGVIAQYLSLVISAGQQIAYFAANSDELNAVAKLVTWYLYSALIESAFENISTPTVFAIPANDLTTSSSSSADCAPTGYEPCCPNCGGDAGGNRCNGDPKTNKFRAGCPCIGNGPPSYKPYFNDSQGYRDAQSLFANLPDLGSGAFWTAESFDGVTCTSPSTTACATYNHKARRGIAPDATGAPELMERQAPGLTCIGSCPQNPPPAGPAITCTCVI